MSNIGYDYLVNGLVRHAGHQPEQLGPTNLGQSRGAVNDGSHLGTWAIGQMHVHLG